MIHFGTGGWRAVIGEDFIKSNICLAGRAVAERIREEGAGDRPVVLGYDRRFLSREAMVWLAEVLSSQGLHTLLIGVASPTPLVMYYVMAHGLQYGLMVTASHNPSLYNGIKVITAGGRDASEEVTADLETRSARLEQQQAPPVRPAADLEAEGLLSWFNPINEYLDSILAKIDVAAIRRAGLRIAIDPLYGVALRSLNVIFATARCDVTMLHTEHDTLFAGKNPSPDENTVRTLQNYVTDYGIDLGIATDGDGDRIALIDDRGNYISANEILAILYYYFLEYKGMRTPIVKNLATSVVLDRIARAYGQTCYEVPVGFKYISAKMAETGAYIGGESSGGLTVQGHINGKDAIYAAALLVETVAVTGRRLSELLREMRERFGCWRTLECNLAFRPERRQELMHRIYEQRDLPAFDLPVRSISSGDGCKVVFENEGWLLIRFSGTEPLLRIFCEMPENEEKIAERLCKSVRMYYNV